ncbi:hypothetical protein [Simkania negevensis]|uniref:Uncharacterized protein n=1 Tax=Simkania negevensis (strain ATCC VR-1471 / DSM 27360 / Z) TaxID=331113 RepID=F8L6L1_SIMNZ|nr:hypothetical protein [Simkania negevensis]CCB88357.1 hypothetical protein SNE_A04800 [Simkania negevensis Z]
MSRISKKRTIIFSLLCVFFFAFAIFHHTLICYGVKFFLTSRLPKGETLVVDYESGHWEKGAYVLHHVSLSRQSAEKSSGFEVKVEDLRFVFSLQFFPFHFGSQLVIDSPEIALLDAKRNEKKKKKGLYSLCEQFLFKKEIFVNRGKVALNKDRSMEAYFSIETGQGADQQGTLFLAHSEEALENAPLKAHFFRRDRDFEFDVHFNELQLPWMFSMARFFSLPIDPSIQLSEGNLSGGLAFGLSSANQISHIQYDLKLIDFTLNHAYYGVAFTAYQINWREHFTSNDEMGPWTSHPFFEKIWPYFVGDGEFYGAKISFEDPETKANQGVVELRGRLQFSHRNQPLVDFHGLFTKDGREYPLRLLGEGLIENDQNWKMAVDLSLQEEGGEKMSTYMAFSSLGSKKYQFESRFQNISEDPVDLVQRLVKIKYPHLKPYFLEQGNFEGAFVGLIENRRFQSLDVKKLNVGQAQLRDLKHNFLFSAKQMKGNGEFDFSNADFFDGTFWELKIHEGAFDGFENVHVARLDADLSMHDQYLKPSKVTAILNGIESDMHFEGLYTHLNVNLDFGLTPKTLFELFGHERKNALSQFDEKLALDFDMHLRTSREELSIEGNLDLIRENCPTDSVLFGAKWEMAELLHAGFLNGLNLGWFKAGTLSAETINLPLEFFEKNWRAQGRAALEGTLNREKIALSLDPSDLVYTSPYVQLEAGYCGEKAPSCHFRYDLISGQWFGKLPLKNAKLIEKSFGIEFDSFSSELELEGDFFEFQNVVASAQGTSFKGAVSLDYQYGDYAELCIKTDEIKGSTQAIQKFLRHFSPFSTMDLPLGGEVTSGENGMILRAFVGEREELLGWEVSLTLHNGAYPITPSCSFQGLTTRFEWSWRDQVLSLIESDGYLRLGEGKSPKNYHLNIPVARADFKKGSWDYDLRLETPTHDICRLVGDARRDEAKKELQIHIDPELTRFFGAKVNFRKFSIGDEGKIRCLDFETDLSSRDLYHHLDFLVHAGLLPLKASTLEEMQSPRFEGSTHLKVYLSDADEAFSFEAKSDHFAFGTIDWEKLLIHGERKGNEFKLDHFSVGSLTMTAHMIKEKDTWEIPTFYVDWKNCKLRSEKGLFDKENGVVKLPLKHLNVDLEELLKLVPNLGEYDLSYLMGQLATSGNLECNLSKGLKDWSLDAQLQLLGKDFSKGRLRVESAKPIHLHFSQERGVEIGGAVFHFFHPRSNQHWAKCEFEKLGYDFESKSWRGTQFKLVLPPEMVHHLGATSALPYLGAGEGYLTLFDQPFKWDNQMELTFDFKFGERAEVEGRLKEGYYWIGDKAWYLNDLRYLLSGGEIELKMNTLLDEHPFDLQAQVSLLPHLKTRIMIQETLVEDQATVHPLTIVSNWNQNEGFFIQSIEGAVSGLDFSFHHNPRGSFLDQMVLTGQLKIDVPKLSKVLPKSMQETIQEFEIGKGYELSGDWVISKEKLLDSHFTGYLKGKRFQLMGSEMETLLSEISIHKDHIELAKLNLSDVSGIFSIDDVRIAKVEDQKWKVSIPRIVAQNFRPSLLKKVGRYQGQIKPLHIRDMSFHNIRGILGDAKSFTGKGNLNFTNTFKSDYNILDIPFEILGRLGLDMGLLVPIKGRLDYVMADGKVFLTQLTDSYSEGKRSKFYLSPSEPSFIDLDGNLNINIKMKQYVLLKITEPFTLSIAGTFEDIRYSLK